jgi:hypothetical protein
MTTLTYTGTLRITSCWCGIHLAIPQDLYDLANRHEGRTVFCPLGHKFIYGSTIEGELEKAKERLAEERRRVRATRDLLAQEERSHAATKGHVTRKRKQLSKVVAGVCPVDGCKRHFKDVRRHIATKHPDYSGQS